MRLDKNVAQADRMQGFKSLDEDLSPVQKPKTQVADKHVQQYACLSKSWYTSQIVGRVCEAFTLRWEQDGIGVFGKGRLRLRAGCASVPFNWGVPCHCMEVHKRSEDGFRTLYTEQRSSRNRLQFYRSSIRKMNSECSLSQQRESGEDVSLQTHLCTGTENTTLDLKDSCTLGSATTTTQPFGSISNALHRLEIYFTILSRTPPALISTPTGQAVVCLPWSFVTANGTVQAQAIFGNQIVDPLHINTHRQTLESHKSILLELHSKIQRFLHYEYKFPPPEQPPL